MNMTNKNSGKGLSDETVREIDKASLAPQPIGKLDHNVLLAILFISGESVTIAELASKLSLSPAAVRQGLDALSDCLKDTSLILLQTEDSARLATNASYASYISAFFDKRAQKLSSEALETLACVIMKQPATRREIEDVRHANCEKTLHTLLTAGLIKSMGNLSQPGAPVLYTVTDECLYKFGFKTFEELGRFFADIKSKGAMR